MMDLSIKLNEQDIFDFSSESGAEESQETEIKTDRKTKAVKIIFVILCMIFILEISIYKIIMPSLGSPKVMFSGQKNYTPSELAVVLSTMNSTNWFNFDVEKAVSILASVPGIEAASVRKYFPNKIYVNVQEREPVAMTFINENGRSVAVQIDRNGVLFPEKGFGSSEYGPVPIISGLPVEHLSEGMRIPVKYRALIEQIAAIINKPQKYFAAVSEICVVPKEYGNYELVLIPARSRIRVLTDRSLNEESLKYMMVMLDVVNSMKPNVYEIDLRYGSVSYRTR